MYGLKTPCDYWKDCIKRDSTLCTVCSRSHFKRQDYFEQDQQIVKSRFTETIMKQFKKVE